MEKRDECHRWDKLGLFILGGMVICTIAGIAYGLFTTGALPDGSDGLLGAMVGGLLLYGREIISTIKASWEEVTRGKVNEQLAASGPAAEVTPIPADAVAAAEQTAEAAAVEAAHIAERSER